MYQRSDLKNLYDRLKAQYPQYGLDFSGDRLTMTRLHSKVEVDREGVKLYVNGELYDQFTSGDVDDPEASERERFEMYLERAKKADAAIVGKEAEEILEMNPILPHRSRPPGWEAAF